MRTFTPGTRAISGTVEVPGDKSLSHRALILGAMAAGTSRLDGLGPGADVASTASCLRALGIGVDGGVVTSPGVDGWLAPGSPLDAGNSGTTMRLLAGALSGRPFTATLVGDDSLMSRPMARLVEPLAVLGARVTVGASGTAPVTIEGRALRGGSVRIDRPSAQVRTAVALAALQATGGTIIDSPPGYRDHTERWLVTLGRARVSGTRLEIDPGLVEPLELRVPGDPSSAAFLWTAAALGGGSVTTPGVSLNPGRTGLLDILEQMGAIVTRTDLSDVLGDPVGTVTVEGPVSRPAVVEGALTVRTLDEIPLVALLGAAVPGTTIVRDAAELAVKESNRLESTAEMLRAIGGTVTVAGDGLTVSGGRPLHDGIVQSYGDHRIAMAGAVAALAAGSVVVAGFDAAAVSWPGFANVLEAAWS